MNLTAAAQVTLLGDLILEWEILTLHKEKRRIEKVIKTSCMQKNVSKARKHAIINGAPQGTGCTFWNILMLWLAHSEQVYKMSLRCSQSGTLQVKESRLKLIIQTGLLLCRSCKYSQYRLHCKKQNKKTACFTMLWFLASLSHKLHLYAHEVRDMAITSEHYRLRYTDECPLWDGQGHNHCKRTSFHCICTAHFIDKCCPCTVIKPMAIYYW